MKPMTHLNEAGEARMVDVGAKSVTARQAIASGRVHMTPATADRVRQGALPKGDVLATARIAGIMAAKNTATLIPLCHPLPIDSAEVEINVEEASVRVRATVRTTAKTGIEMEALAAVSMAALTIYDMCKAIDKAMTIGDIRLDEKSGGKSGHYIRDGADE